MFRMDGKVALVTGASRGLGAAIGDGLAAAGARVYGSSRDRADAERIAARYGTSPIVLDLQHTEQFAHALNEILRGSQQIDVLCNNAGINKPQAATAIDVDTWTTTIDVNLTGTFFLTQTVARHWIVNHAQGVVVNIGSQAGTVAIEDRACYGSSKAALAQLTKSLAFEWAPHNIRVNAVAPTFIETELTRATLADPARRAEIVSRIPLGRLGSPEDVASAVVYLSSNEARMVTGHVLLVDGGYTIH